MLIAKYHAGRTIRTADRSRELSVTAQDGQDACLSVRESFRREYSLYYIPVIPLYGLWQEERHLPAAELLTAVFAYLYVNAGISYYQDDDTFMFTNYEILEDWLVDAKEEDEEAFERQYACFEQARDAGDFVQEKMMDSGLRERFGQIVNGFVPGTPYEFEALDIARRAWTLLQAFPKAHLFQHSSDIVEDEDDYCYNTTIFMHEYIGFVGSTNDALSENLFSMVENDFNERSYAQEPELVTVFDGVQPAYTDELSYEEHLLSLIDDLCTLLLTTP